MNGRKVDENVQLPDSTANDRSAPAPTAAGSVARNGSAANSAQAPIRVADAGASSDVAPVAQRAPAPGMRSRFGPPGSFLKRVVERLTRFQTTRQDAVNAQVAASLGSLGTVPREIAELRGDLRDAALDFGAIADRMRAFENTRRVVERTAPFRSEVRSHRRQLAELREDVAALSARLTYVQREGAPVRADMRAILGEIESLRGGCERLAELVRETQALEAEGRALESARTEARIGALQKDIDQVRMASARDLAQRSTELRAIVEEVERRLSQTAEHLTALVEMQSQASDTAFGALRSDVAASGDALRLSLEDRIERAQRTAATLRTAVDALTREAAGDRERSAAAVGRITAAEQQVERLEAVAENLRAFVPAQNEALRERIAGDVAGALNAVRDSGVEEPAATARRLQEALDTVRSELEALRGSLLSTPYMSAPIEAWPELRLSTPDDFDYVGFEDVFRGPEPFIRERLRAYVPLVKGRAPVVELGSGRGEFLEVMRENGIAATGVDLDAHAVARARAKGLDNVVAGDANAYLAGFEKSSVGAIFSAQFAEHLPFAELLRCLELARTRLVPGGVFIAETVNPNSIEAWKTFYVDPSHEKPLFPEVFLFLCVSMGFSDVRIFYPNSGGFAEAAPTMQHEYAVVATAPIRARSRTAAPPSAPNGPRRRRKAQTRK